MDSENFRLAVELRDRLLAELRQTPLFRAYLSAQETVAALSAESIAQPTQQRSTQQQVRRGEASRQSPSKPGTQAEVILTSAAAYLRDKSSRAPSTEISKALAAQGITIGGKDSSATVAAYLTHSPLFDNIRGQGYGLAEWSKPKTETPNSSELFGAPKTNGAEPLSP
jgi:hypothetical protein